jgi:hypothetical protein
MRHPHQPAAIPFLKSRRSSQPDPTLRCHFVRSPGRFTMRRPLRMVIQNAYQLLQDAQLVGAPRWLASDRFDIVATAPGNPSQEQMMLMLGALLADRSSWWSTRRCGNFRFMRLSWRGRIASRTCCRPRSDRPNRACGRLRFRPRVDAGQRENDTAPDRCPSDTARQPGRPFAVHGIMRTAWTETRVNAGACRSSRDRQCRAADA